MDIGDWSLLGTAPGFVKKYCRGVRRVLKKHNSKRNRQQGKLQIVDEDQPSTQKPMEDKTVHYSCWTRAKR